MAPFKRKTNVIFDAIQLELPWQDRDGRLFVQGDWLVKKDDGEMYGVPKDMFDIHFEPATESDVLHVRHLAANRNWQSTTHCLVL